MPSPRHRDPYRIFLLRKRVELCLFIELASGGMSVSVSVSVADAAPVPLQACS